MDIPFSVAAQRTETVRMVRPDPQDCRRPPERLDVAVTWCRGIAARTLLVRGGRQVSAGQCYGGPGGGLRDLGRALDVVRETARANGCGPGGWNPVELRLVARIVETPVLAGGSPIPDGLFVDPAGSAAPAAARRSLRARAPLERLAAVPQAEILVWSSARTEDGNAIALQSFLAAALDAPRHAAVADGPMAAPAPPMG